MTGKKYFMLLLLTAAITINCKASTMEKTSSDTVDIYTANQYLAKTLNIAFTFDAPKEGAWGHTLQAEDFKIIKDAGFTAVRLPIQWVTRMDSIAPYKIDKQFLLRIDWAIKEALKNHLAIILDNHLDAQLMKDPAAHRERFLSLWRQLSVYYRKYPQKVMFEVMAEPRDSLDALWNTYFADALSIIRETNPNRPVIVGPELYNMAYKLNDLLLPEKDRYLIVTFHFYNPIKFTMQGEDWFPIGNPREWIGTQWTGTAAEKGEISYTMSLVASWAKKHDRPIFMGEFGAGNRADTASKVRYFTFCREQAEQNGFSWGFFNFIRAFSLYDEPSKKWNDELLHALIPPH